MAPLQFMGPEPVELYCDRLSAAAGETVRVHGSSRLGPVDVEVVCETGGRRVAARLHGVPIGDHPTPATAASDGCGWPVAFELEVGADWPSGVYFVEATAGGASGRAFFVVRPQPARAAPLLLVLSTNTYVAYSNWGGPSLYQGAHCVAFDRPWPAGFLVREETPAARAANAAAEPDPERSAWLAEAARQRISLWAASAGWFTWERRFAAWAQEAGFRLDFAVSTDLERHPEMLDGCRCVVSAGHDEYWSWGMRDTLERFVEGGGNAAFLSANAVFWQVRYERDGNTLVCHKYDAPERDPVVGGADERLMTGMWSDPLVGRPETALTGVTFTRGGYHRIGNAVPRGAGGYTVWRPEHWIFEDTGLRYGDVLGADARVVGYEADGCALRFEDGLPHPTHADGCPPTFVPLATAPARLYRRDDMPSYQRVGPDELDDAEYVAQRLFGTRDEAAVERAARGNAVMGVHEPGGTVFTAGTTDWAYGLGRDARVDQITRNVLARLAGDCR